jgi:coenzyme PQQ precursor peptide PqqA
MLQRTQFLLHCTIEIAAATAPLLRRRRRSAATPYLSVRDETAFSARVNSAPEAGSPPQKTANETAMEEQMTEFTWTAPEACEVCVGMEVTSYMSAAL